jgi:hypothetical protein
MSERYALYTAKLSPAAGAKHITSIESHRWSPSSTKSPYSPGGSVDLAFQSLAVADPVHEFTTPDLSTILGSGGVDPAVGLNCGSGAVFTRIHRADNSVFTATSSSSTHVTFTSSAGFACLQSISAGQDDEGGAMATVLYYPQSSDGQAAPETVAKAAINSTVNAPAYVSRYFLSLVKAGGSEIPSVSNVSIDFGKEFKRFRFSGDVFPKSGSIVSRRPTVSVTCAASGFNSTLQQFTNNSSGAGTLTVFLQKESNSTANGRVAKGTSQHIKLTATGLEYSVDEDSVTNNEDATVTFTMSVLGTVAGSVASAIS